MKNEYLSNLKNLLDGYQMEETEKEDIVNDYSDMYDNWIEQGMSEEDVENKLGSPKSIIYELVEGYRRVTDISPKRERRNTKVIALTPFIALIIFFVIGVAYDGWAYGWTAFLLIPITAIIVEMTANKDDHVFTALSPFVATATYIFIGLAYDLWHPGWMVFLFIPVVALLVEAKKNGFIVTITSLSPFAAIVAFFILGEQGLWNPGWLVFMIIPAIGVLNEKNVLKVLLWEVAIIGGSIGYLLIWNTTDEVILSSLCFIPLIALVVLQDIKGIFDMPREYKLVSVAAIVGYVLIGFLGELIEYSLWGYGWLIFFIIPLFAINKEVDGDEKIIAYTPFIATIVFFSLGWFFNLWGYAWLAYLIIPVTAIIKEA